MLERLYRLYTTWITPRQGAPRLARPQRPLSELSVALITTAGVRLRAQPAFDTRRGDASLRLIPRASAPEGLIPDHTHYDTGPAGADIDCVFPTRVLERLAVEHWIGEVAPHHYGLMGYIPDTAPLLKETIPALIRQLQADKADVALLSPG